MRDSWGNTKGNTCYRPRYRNSRELALWRSCIEHPANQHQHLNFGARGAGEPLAIGYIDLGGVVARGNYGLEIGTACAYETAKLEKEVE